MIELIRNKKQEIELPAPPESFNSAYKKGEAEGYEKGYEKGSAEGYPNGYKDGEAAGYNTGYVEGEAIGFGNGFAEGEQEGYVKGEESGIELGKQAQYDLFWDNLQDNGNRTHYGFAFSGEMWTAETFKPKYPIRGTNMQNAFAYWGQNYARTELIDLSQFEIDFSKATIIANAFYRSYQILAIGEIDTRAASNINGMFQDARNLETIEKIILKDDGSTGLTNTFTNARNLTNIAWEGVIGQSLTFYTNCPLTHDSLMNTINHLKRFSANATESSNPNTAQEVEGTYTITSLNFYEFQPGSDLWVCDTTLAEADFTISFFHYVGYAGVEEMLKEGNKVYIKYSPSTGFKECMIYSPDATTTHTLTLGAQNLAKLTDAEKAKATEKGWTLA